jgi:hypothetical protein
MVILLRPRQSRPARKRLKDEPSSSLRLCIRNSGTKRKNDFQDHSSHLFSYLSKAQTLDPQYLQR